MNRIKNVFVAFAAALLALAAAPAMATTDCDSHVAWVYVDAGSSTPDTQVGLTSGASFHISYTDTNRSIVLAAAYLALSNGSAMTARFTAAGVNCATSTGRTDLVGFYVYNT